MLGNGIATAILSKKQKVEGVSMSAHSTGPGKLMSLAYR
jgi:hypothetical protein